MKKVLFVDDEVLITNSLRRGLITEKYERFFANSGEEALLLMKQHEFAVLCTDMKMPGMSGLDLLKIVKEKYPDVIKIVLSGYTHLPQILVTINQGDIFKFISKPWDLENEFKFILREALDYHEFQMQRKHEADKLRKKNETFQNIIKSYDDKVDGIREDLTSVKDMFNKTTKEIIVLIDKEPLRSDGTLEVVKTMLALNEYYLSIMPVVESRSKIDTFLEKLKASVRAAKPLMRLDVGISNAVLGPQKGAFRLVEATLFLLIDQFIEYDFRTGLKIVADVKKENMTKIVDEQEVAYEQAILQVVMEIKGVAIRYKNVFALVVDLMNVLLRVHGISLEFGVLEDRTVVQLKMPLL